MANKNLFNSIRVRKPKKNVFDLSHDVKLSLDMGKLIPILCLECVPGDVINLSNQVFMRMAPMIAPAMHKIKMYTHTFFVPRRITWQGWEEWITNPSSTRVCPTFGWDSTIAAEYRAIGDYMGLPNMTSTIPVQVDAMPFMAYQMIYNEYYRDQNLIPALYPQNDAYSILQDGDNSGTSGLLLTMRYRAWTHDYFTAALPWAQKGAIVDIPLGTAMVRLNPDRQENAVFRDLDGDVLAGTVSNATDGTQDIRVLGESVSLDPRDTLQADFDPTSINSLRRAFRLQEWLEKAARGGTRLVEMLYSMFGVKSDDARLQNPEFIYGTSSPLMISEVLNTAGAFDPTDPDLPGSRPQGDMAGHGIGVSDSGRGRYYCKEHGFIITILSVLPAPAYQQGLPRMYSKYSDMFEHYWPDLAHIGEQEVLNKEIYADQNSGTRDEVFGYVPRYSEYKYMPSRVCGDFRTTLDYWHLGRIFDNAPALNQDFVECKPDKRIFAVQDENLDSLWCHVFHRIRAVRPMPKFGTPSF